MKLIDDRIRKEEVLELSQELASTLSQALDEDYDVILNHNQETFVKQEFQKILQKFFNVKS